MKYLKREEGMAQLLVIALVVLVAAVVGLAIWQSQQAKTSQTASSPTPSPSTSSSPTPSATPEPTTSYSILDLGVQFMNPSSLSDLDYKVVHLAGDQAVNSVAFSTKRLETNGCSLDSAPLGYLTYDSDKGGSIVGSARGTNLYYLQPQPGCKADASLQNWQALKNALKTVKTGPAR